MTSHVETTSGVQELIDKLKNQGIEEGQAQADQIIKQAQKESAHIIASAKAEADQLFADAKSKIDREKVSAQESIKVAFRDTELSLRSKFREAFSNYLRRLVSYELQDKEFIKQLVLAIAQVKAPGVEQAPKIEIQIPLLEKHGQGIQFTAEGKKQL